MKILTVVNWLDLFQLTLQAESLSKFWTGKKRWTIVIEDPMLEIQQLSLEWCKNNINIPGWDIDFIVPNCSNLYCGWIRQQQHKLYYTSIADEDWVLILDAKNFLIKPTNKSFFIKGNTLIYLPAFRSDEFFKKTNVGASDLLNMHDAIPDSASMTPWVFNKKEVAELIKVANITLENWPMPTDATEFTLYWRWVYHKFNWEPKTFVSGFWSHEFSTDLSNLPVNLNEMKDSIIKTEDMCFWTHHRYSMSTKTRQLTMALMQEIGLDSNVVLHWNHLFQKMLDNKNATRHQEFLKNRAGDDPGFNKKWYNT